MKKLIVAGALIAGMMMTADANAAVRYQLTVLNTNGVFAAPWAINNSSVIVGSVGGRAAYIGESGASFIDVNGQAETYARNINDKGTVIVEALANYSDYKAYTYKNGNVEQIVAPDGTNVTVFGLNNNDEIAGTSRNGSAWSKGFYGDTDNLKTVDGFLGAISDVGVAVGSDRFNRALAVDNTGSTILGALPGGYAYAWSVNESGQVVGQSYNASNRNMGFIYSNGVMTEIGRSDWRDAIAYNINESGVTVGDAETLSSFRQGWVYENGTISYLNDLTENRGGFDIRFVRGQNDLGQIVGWGFDPILGRGSAYLLTPMAAVPEPSAWMLMLTGMMMSGYALRRRVVSAKLA